MRAWAFLRNEARHQPRDKVCVLAVLRQLLCTRGKVRAKFALPLRPLALLGRSPTNALQEAIEPHLAVLEPSAAHSLACVCVSLLDLHQFEVIAVIPRFKHASLWAALDRQAYFFSFTQLICVPAPERALAALYLERVVDHRALGHTGKFLALEG